jgi:hypothetical protein
MGMRKGVSNEQIKALAMAMAGATVAAVATMFVPAAMLESFTGATGLSELVPASAAPLGDTARALIAFGVGALTLAVLAYLLLRQENAPRSAAPEPVPSRLEMTQETRSFTERLASFALPKMPWNKSDDDITELADLPKLRNGDSHPDAPPRRPLSAQQDLPVLDLAKIAVAEPVAEDTAFIEVEEVEATEEFQHSSIPITQPLVEAAAPSPALIQSEIQPTLAEMVAQLEAAVAERQSQLAELEAVAAQLGAGQVSEPVLIEHPADEKQTTEPARMERPPLEAVPESVKDDDMDSALAAALATLHRMNGTNR